jgi:hypothetical protein
MYIEFMRGVLGRIYSRLPNFTGKKTQINNDPKPEEEEEEDAEVNVQPVEEEINGDTLKSDIQTIINDNLPNNTDKLILYQKNDKGIMEGTAIPTKDTLDNMNSDVDVNNIIVFRSKDTKSNYTNQFGIVESKTEDNNNYIKLYTIRVKQNGANGIQLFTTKSQDKTITITISNEHEINKNISVRNNKTNFDDEITDYFVIGTWENKPSTSGGKRRSDKRRSNKRRSDKLRVVSKRRHRKSSLAKRRSIKRRPHR